MILKATLLGKTYAFGSVKEVLAKANEPKSGDTLAGIAAADAKERIAAKAVLSQLTVADITEHPAVSYEADAVTRIILDDLDKEIYARWKNTTIADLREWVLDNARTGAELLEAGRGLSSEVIAALAKLMGNLDLMYTARKLQITAHCNTTIGTPGTFACRLQPNHPTDDVAGVTASLLEGLSYGIGDAVIGLNPAIDTVESTTAILNLFNDVKKQAGDPHTNLRTLPHYHANAGTAKRRANGPAVSVHCRVGKRTFRLWHRGKYAGRSQANDAGTGYLSGAKSIIL